MNSPGTATSALDLQIHLTSPLYFAVMTPCCSIEAKSISLAPLGEARHSFFSNPRFVEDMTKINSLLSPADALSPQHLAALSEEKRAEELAKGPSYVYYDCFVYEPHALFGTYVIKKGQSSWKVGHRLVDFKSIFRVECEQ